MTPVWPDEFMRQFIQEFELSSLLNMAPTLQA